jgi:hypothetical protein
MADKTKLFALSCQIKPSGAKQKHTIKNICFLNVPNDAFCWLVVHSVMLFDDFDL